MTGEVKIFIFLFFLISLISCEKDKYLNPNPSAIITEDVAFESSDRILHQVNGLYSKLKHGNFLGSYYFIMSDIRAGDFVSANLNAATGSITYQMNVETTTSEVRNIWSRGYQVINASNVFIDNMENGGLEITGDDLGNNYIAEARFIRAVAYYYLLQLYARPYWDGNGSKPGLPLRLVGNTTFKDYSLARSSVKEVYEQIIKDLDYAEINLPEQYASSFLNTTRAHKNTAIAFKTKVYLSMGDYHNVITEANKIVSASNPFHTISGVYNALVPDIRKVFESPYLTEESIFSLPYTNEDPPGEGFAMFYLPGTGDGGTSASNGRGDWYLYKEGIPSDPNWSMNDDRRSFIKEGTRSHRLWLTKYSQASPYLDYTPIIRYAEVLLNLSEALVRENGIDGRSISLFNAVRNRSDSSHSFTVNDFLNEQQFYEVILKERQIEFLGEGIRNADLMRLGMEIPAKPIHSVPAVDPGDFNYIYPISNDELNLNDLIENN